MASGLILPIKSFLYKIGTHCTGHEYISWHCPYYNMFYDIEHALNNAQARGAGIALLLCQTHSVRKRLEKYLSGASVHSAPSARGVGCDVIASSRLQWQMSPKLIKIGTHFTSAGHVLLL